MCLKNTPGRTVNIFSSEKITLFHLGYCSNDVANFSLLTLFSAESNGLRTGCIVLNPAAFKILVTVSLVNMRGTCYIETIQNLGKKRSCHTCTIAPGGLFMSAVFMLSLRWVAIFGLLQKGYFAATLNTSLRHLKRNDSYLLLPWAYTHLALNTGGLPDPAFLSTLPRSLSLWAMSPMELFPISSNSSMSLYDFPACK